MYYFGSGRAAIFMISLLMIATFSSNVIFVIGKLLIDLFYLDFLGLNIDNMLKVIAGVPLADSLTESSLTIKTILMVLILIGLYPLCLTKDFHNIRVRNCTLQALF